MGPVLSDPPPTPLSLPSPMSVVPDDQPATLGTHIEPYADAPEIEVRDSDRFRTLRLFARGGQGHVFVARDEQLGRDVAVKELQPQFANKSVSRIRFIREAEITGSLEHPGVVPVYALGRNKAGRPYYAMRLIQGRTLHQVVQEFHDPRVGWTIADRNVRFRQLLQRFVSVCQTIAYAHSRGIVHRDIKPANVLIGSYGEAVVVDWGLARPYHLAAGCAFEPESGLIEPGNDTNVSADSTQMGSALGTPAFMSPEQAQGQWDHVGPATDIYALGATLYAVLTGKNPLESGTWSEIRTKILVGDIPRPRSLLPSIPRGLEAVCLKAMALLPADRYTTVPEMAQDIEHWLADERVLAGGESWGDHIRRWGRQHRTLVAAIAVLGITTLVGLGVGLVAVNREQERTESARVRTRSALDRLTSTVIDDWLANQRELLPEHRLFLEQALADAETFAAEAVHDPEGRLGVVRAYRRVGEICLKLGDARSSAAFATARERVEALPPDEAVQVQCRRELARILAGLGQLARNSKKPAEAEAHFASARTIREQVAASSESTDYQSDLASAVSNHATAQSDRDPRSADALASFREAVRLRRLLVRNKAGDAECRRALAEALNNLGVRLTNVRQYVDAIATFREAKGLTEPMAARVNAAIADREEYARACQFLGQIAIGLKQPDGRALMMTAAGQYDRLTLAAPNVPLYALELAAAHCNLGKLDMASNKEAALTHFDEAIAAVQAHQGRDETTRRAVVLHSARVGRAEAFSGLGRFVDAAEAWEVIVAADSANASLWRSNQAMQWLRAGQVERALTVARMILADPSANSEAYYNGACVFAQSIAIDPSKAAERAELAFSLLRIAAAKGYFKIPGRLGSFDADTDMAPLRDRREFREFRAVLTP